MKKQIFALTAVAALTSGFAMAAEEEQADMSDPTAAYTAVGIGYGNEGMNMKLMYMNSDPASPIKTGFLLEVNDPFDKEGGDPKFSGGVHPVMGPNGTPVGVAPNMNDKQSNRNYRFRYGSINTENGLGHMLDMVLADHPFYGQIAVPQIGALATLPLFNDKLYLWPVFLVGGVIAEDNTKLLAESVKQAQPSQAGTIDALLATRSSGMDWASTIYSFKTYARYKFTDSLWLLGAYTYTEDMSGKSWDASIQEGGLQMSSEQLEMTLGYQITPSQNLRFNYHHFSGNGSKDKLWIDYNYSF